LLKHNQKVCNYSFEYNVNFRRKTMRKLLILILAIGITIGLYSTSFAVNVSVDSTAYSGLDYTYGYTETFGAGTYNITVVDGAWRSWDVRDFDTDVLQSLADPGWLWSLVIYNGTTDTMLGDHSLGGVYVPSPPTAANILIAQGDALANSFGQTITLTTDGDFTFYIYDDTNRGAEGSVTVDVSVVPEPISSALFVVGGTLLAGRRFINKRKKAVL
jgi:hypothetical protein